MEKIHSDCCGILRGGECTCIAVNPFLTEAYRKKLEEAGVFKELFWEDTHDLLVELPSFNELSGNSHITSEIKLINT